MEPFGEVKNKMADLFGVEVHTIKYHLKRIFASGELREEATIRKFRTVQPQGARHNILAKVHRFKEFHYW